MTDPQTTFRSAIWNHAGKVLEYILMYLTSVLIARGLGVQENGIFVGLFSISQLLLVVTSFGLEVSLNKHIPQIGGESRDKHIRYVLRRVIAVRVLGIFGVAALLYTSMHLFSEYFPTVLSQYIWLLLGYTGVRSVVNLFVIMLTAELETRATASINVLTRMLEVVLIGMMVPGGMSTMNVFAVLLMAATLQLAAYVVVSRRNIIGKTERLAVLPILMFGGIYWINTAVEYFLGRQGDVLFLTMLLPDSTQASLYDVAFAVTQLASLSLTVGLGGITLATSARLALRSSELLERFYGFMIRVVSLLSIPLYAFILFNAGSVLFVLYSSRYVAAASLIQGIAGFRIAGRLFGGPENAEFLLSRSEVSKLVGIGIVGAAVNVGLDLLLIPRMGPFGAVLGSGFGNLAVNAFGAFAVYRSSSVRMQWQCWMQISAASCGASLLCSLLLPSNNLALVIGQGVLYAFITVVILFMTKPLTAGDSEWLSKIDNRVAVLLRPFVQASSPTPNVDPQ